VVHILFLFLVYLLKDKISVLCIKKKKKGKVQNQGTSIIIQKERSYQGDKREKAAPEHKQ